MCESLRNGDLPKFTEDFVPVDKSNKWLSDVEPYDADVLLTEDLTAVPGTFILAPKLAARKLVGLGASIYDNDGSIGDDDATAGGGGGGGGGGGDGDEAVAGDAAGVWAAAGMSGALGGGGAMLAADGAASSSSGGSSNGNSNQYRLSFRGEKCEAYHLSVKLVLNRNYQNRPGGTSQVDLSADLLPPHPPSPPEENSNPASDGHDGDADGNADGANLITLVPPLAAAAAAAGGGGGGGGGRGPTLLPSRPIGRSTSTSSTRRMYSYTIDQDEHDAHGKDFKAELKAAGYLDVRLATLEDVVEFCRLKPLRLGLHGGIVFPTRQKFFRSDHDSTAAASASLELPFPLGNDRGGQQMGNVQGRMPTWKVEVASAEPPASRVGGSTSVSIALGLRAGSNASSQSLPIEHNFSEDTDGGGGSSGTSGGGGGGAAASSGKLIVWTLSAPPAMRRKNPLEDLGIGICWDLHDDKLGTAVIKLTPHSFLPTCS